MTLKNVKYVINTNPINTNKIIKPQKGKSDGTLYRAEVLEKRINPNNNKEEYYVHYEGLDRRLDEWIPGKVTATS